MCIRDSIYAMPGMRHSLGQVPVIGQEQQPLGIIVQTPYRVDTLGNIPDKISYGTPLSLIHI